jgi:ParB-like chromosome segregation protein Spo0J
LALPGEAFQLEMRQRLLRHSWSVRDTERQVRLKLNSLPGGLEIQVNKKAVSGGPVTEGSRADHDAQLQNLEEKLQHLLQTRVKIKYHKGRGQIQIDYFSLEEFDRLYDLLISY